MSIPTAQQAEPAGVLLELEAVTCRLPGGRRLDIPHFLLRVGEHWSIEGGNGAGKSLFASVLQGRLPISGGELRRPADGDPRQDVMVVSFEEQSRLWRLDDRHDISEFATEGQDPGTTVESLIWQGEVGDAAQQKEVSILLDVLGLTPLRRQGIRYLSSGQLRKSLLARALVARRLGRCRIVVLDDPLASIDRATREPLRDLLSAWMDRHSCTVQLCRRRADRLAGITHIGRMEDLRLVAQGPAENPVIDPKIPANHALPLAVKAPPTALPDRIQPPAPAILFQLAGVSVRFGERLILDDIHWCFPRGAHAVVEGPNGCGKSTLLSLINGENHKAYGQPVTVFGYRRGSGESVWDIKARFGVVSNELHGRYVQGCSVLEVVVSGWFDSVGLYRDPVAREVSHAREWLAALGIGALAGQRFQDLSFGEQRLVLLARAMVKHPAVLVLDEPCVGLDDLSRERILTMVDHIASTTPTQVIWVSHTVGEAPRCITQQVRFLPLPSGAHTLKVSGTLTTADGGQAAD